MGGGGSAADRGRIKYVHDCLASNASMVTKELEESSSHVTFTQCCVFGPLLMLSFFQRISGDHSRKTSWCLYRKAPNENKGTQGGLTSLCLTFG